MLSCLPGDGRGRINNMKKIIIVLICVVALVVFFALMSPSKNPTAFKNKLAYLNNIPEISWVEFDGNNAYIGFKKYPPDLRLIMSSAALIGNKANGFGVHLWAVEATQRGWRPGKGHYYCECTARYGKIQNNSCR